MQQITVLRQLANEYITLFNQHAAKGMANSIELQTETALEALAEVAYRNQYAALYRAISDCKNQLEQHRIISPVSVVGVEA
ncbi:MAG: hypothetical protein H9917_04990 [Candidatus Oceanisphaera merdipullorum]|nr:hypothetical protein [Candidatus Oceanisphaera merdipullorum]